jgi:ligand-binding sensor domain-containing protein
MMKKSILLLFLLLFCGFLSAQEPLRFTTKQGLPSNHIYDIQEDENGFMWFATNRGLVKFDGETFKTFTIQDGLPNNDTWLLELDYQGRLWYFSKSSYQGYIENDSIYKFQTKDKKVISPRFNYKTKNQFWFSGGNGIETLKENVFKQSGLYKNGDLTEYNINMLKLAKKFDFSPYKSLVALNPDIREIAVIKQNEMLFFDWNFKHIKTIQHKLPSSFNSIKIESRGLVYNGVFYMAIDKGIFFINFKTKQSSYVPFSAYVDEKPVNYFKFKGLKNEIQISIPGHLFIFNYQLELLKTHSFPKGLENRISYKDSKGNLWSANFTDGLTLVPKNQQQTSYGLKNKKVQKLGFINKQLFAGVNDDGFYKMNGLINVFDKIVGNISIANGEIYQIKEKPTYLISAGKSFTYVGDEISQVKLPVSKGQGYYTSKETSFSFKDVVHHKNKTYYVTSASLVEKKDNDIKYFLKIGLMEAAVFQNELYMSGSDGLFVLENDSIQKPPSKNKLLSVSISSMLSIPDYLIVGTDGRGVYLYSKNKVQHIKDTDGLSVQRIIKNENSLWLATQKGVKKISLNVDDLSNSKITNSFYDADGLLQNNTNDIYVEKDTLYVASDTGIAKLTINDAIYKQQPKLYFKTKSDTLRYINDARENISVTFGLHDYVNQHYVKYQYRLLPSQKKWTTTKSKILNFSNLSPDLYQLQIKATDQHFNETVVKQYLDVQPNWWQTTIAKIGFILLAVLGFMGFIKILQKRIQQKEEGKAQLDKKIAGLELQALRSQMNPHFVHNSLNAIQYYIQRNEVEQSENYLVKFSKLVRLFFEYSRRQNISIEEEVVLLNNYLEIEKLRFEDKLSYTLEVDENIDAGEQLIPSMMLQPILENAVNHGLFHKKENGLVSVLFRGIGENSFKIVVEDDGIGIIKSREMYKDSSKNYQSKSSAVLEERLELLQQSNEWKIEYTIQDLSEVNNTNGTRVTLIFNQTKL